MSNEGGETLNSFVGETIGLSFGDRVCLEAKPGRWLRVGRWPLFLTCEHGPHEVGLFPKIENLPPPFSTHFATERPPFP